MLFALPRERVEVGGVTTSQFSVAGQSVLITGASRGIGRRIAEQFAAGGANVALCSREQANVDPVADAINARNGGDSIAVECDVRNREAVDGFVDASVEAFGGLDSLINNAGASFMAAFDELSENAWKTIIDINLHGTFNCTQAAGTALCDGDGGTVVNIASVAGLRGAPQMSHYGAAKAGVSNLTRTLAYEWAPDGVRVNCIAPGFIATPGVESQMGITADEINRETVNRRIGAPSEIADIAQFLASPAASYLVGETIVAEGLPRVEDSPEV